MDFSGAVKIKLLHMGSKKLKPTQILAFGFAFLILVGGILLNLPAASKNGHSIGLLNALFTATSAVCVTGLVVADTFTQFSIFGQVVIMLLIQMGGLGIMTMATLVFLLLGKKITLRERLVMQEALNQLTLSGLVKLTRHILLTTIAFEGVGAILLSIRFTQFYGLGRGLYYGLFHAVSAFNNAGFDLLGGFRSLTSFVEDPIINIVIMSLIVFGGLGFSVIYDILSTKDFRRLSLHSKVVIIMTSILLFRNYNVLCAGMRQSKNNGRTYHWKMLAAAFQSVTTRTAGFNTINCSDLTVRQNI